MIAFLTSAVPEALAPRRPFIKMQGLRNHFVFLDQRRGAPALSAGEIIRICDVHVGVGAEQVITIENPSAEALGKDAHAAMRIFNIDGREAGACGNATRCMAHLMFEETGRDEVTIETLGGLLVCRKAGGNDVSVTLGPISMDWQGIPASGPCNTGNLPIESGPLRNGMGLHIGNSHAVFFVDDFDAIEIPAVAPAIQNSPLFPEGVNVGVAQVIDGKTIKLAVWERPGMLTQACGTGACVAAYAARLRGLVQQDDIAVHLPAGPLMIRLLADKYVEMTGPVEVCCVGYV